MKIDLKIPLEEGGLAQVCEVTWDAEAKIKTLWETFGIGPWAVYYLQPPDLYDHYYRGVKVEDSAFICAIAKSGNFHYEISQPIHGIGLHREFLETRGPGLHHVKIYYEDTEKAKALYKSKGLYVLEEGKFRDDHWVFFDTEKEHGVIWEISNCADVGKPTKVYP